MTLYKNSRIIFKRNISIDKGYFGAYRTIIPQTLPAKRVTAAKFFQKNRLTCNCAG
jgi:hypothetical protein